MKYRLLSLLFILILFPFHLSSIEVGGHLTEDTIWSPDNNPYIVTETLFVDSGVTLTILPGTMVKVNGASLTSYAEYIDNFWLHYGVSIAKYIQVDGRIIAEGTAQDSIIFTRLQDDPTYNWGSIRITEGADLSFFKYCHIEHTANIGIGIGIVSRGLEFDNGRGSVRNCTFLNNAMSIYSESVVKELEIIDNVFIINSNINPGVLEHCIGQAHIFSGRNINVDSPNVFICNNQFEGYGLYSCTGASKPSFAYNSVSHCTSSGGTICLYYKNVFVNCSYAISGGDSLYIKNNQFIDGSYGINLDYAYVEISDNYFEGCDLDTHLNCYGKVFNNIINNSSLHVTSYLEVYNNISTSGNTGIVITFRNESNSNNISINNQYAFGGYFSNYYSNCIILANDELTQYGVSGNPVFRNCIIDFPLDPPLIDGGGNIIVDSVQAQSIFQDIQNGDFHLAPSSIAIDAGFDTLGYYYPFDMDYNHRVWDGNGNGTAIIDIGPYEYGAPSLGGIQGITFDPTTGDFVDYVLIKINNEPGKFTFSDSVGSYEYKLPAGVYDVYAERVFYDDAVEYQIEVIDGQFTQLDIPMCETVEITQHLVHNTQNRLTNFPNPFNPSTTIEFSIQNDSKIDLSIFNIKGQKIATLINEHQAKGKHSVVWSGCDQNGHQVSSGIYLYKLKVGNQESVKRMLLLK